MAAAGGASAPGVAPACAADRNRPPPEAIDVFGIGVVLQDLTHLGMGFAAPTHFAAKCRAQAPGQEALSREAEAGPSSGALVNHTGNGQRRHDWMMLQALSVAYANGTAMLPIGPHVPRALGELLQACTSIEPRTRPSAGAVRDSLRALTSAAADAAARGDAWPEPGALWGSGDAGAALQGSPARPA